MAARASLSQARRTAQEAGRLDGEVYRRPIAHRGLHDRAKGRLENTAPAFLAAIARGYGIECDLQAAKDGTPMVFHDEMLGRLIDAAGPLAAHSPADLSRLRYRGQDSRILRFAEFLELVGGRVPLLVEVKRAKQHPPRRSYLLKIAQEARAYCGPIALMSFDRDIVTGLAELAPAIPHGLIVGSHQLPASWWTTPSPSIRNAAVARRLGSAPPGLDFLAVDVRMLRSARAWMAGNPRPIPLFSWTIRTARERAAATRWADAPIFEGYEA